MTCRGHTLTITGVFLFSLPFTSLALPDPQPMAAFDHAGGLARPHALAGVVVTSITQQGSAGNLTAHAELTHCFPAQPHDGLYLVWTATQLENANATAAFQLCGTSVMDQTSASIGILQARPNPSQ